MKVIWRERYRMTVNESIEKGVLYEDMKMDAWNTVKRTSMFRIIDLELITK